MTSIYIYIYIHMLNFVEIDCIVLCYAMLCYAMLCYAILCYAILYYTILYYTILYYTILYYTILYYTILCCIIVCCIVVWSLNFIFFTFNLKLINSSEAFFLSQFTDYLLIHSIFLSIFFIQQFSLYFCSSSCILYSLTCTVS